jgi:predicted nucleic acid-binding protein
MIVSDATTLIALINIYRLDLLRQFVDALIVPREVCNEVTKRPSARKILDEEIERGFLSVASYSDTELFGQINYILDVGESAAITLAIERNLPLIIDECKGRRFAQRQGIEIIGLVGILRFLHLDGRVPRDEIAQVIEMLDGVGFRMSGVLVDMVLG